MKNILRIGLVIIFVSFGAFAFSSRAALDFKTEASATENAVDVARNLYLKNCARCHGADGRAQTEPGRTLDVPDLTTDKASFNRSIQKITRGGGGMPAFGKKLKKSDINALANYVRGL